MSKMKVAVFAEPSRIVLDSRPAPDVEQAYELFSSQRDGVLKVAITP